MPWVDWITPNWAELALLSERPVDDLASAEAAARGLIARHPGLGVVATGGDQDTPTELLVTAGQEAVAIRGAACRHEGDAWDGVRVLFCVAGAAGGGMVRRPRLPGWRRPLWRALYGMRRG